MKTFINYLNENKIQSKMITTAQAKFWVIRGTEKHELSYHDYGVLHREDGPAIEDNDGTKVWYKNGIRHREDGPAEEYRDGAKYWYINDKKHREDGPAFEGSDNVIEWWLNDKEIEPTDDMMSKYIRLNPYNIFKDYEWPKNIQALAIELGGDEIRDRLIKEKKIHPSLIVKGLDKLDKRGFFS